MIFFYDVIDYFFRSPNYELPINYLFILQQKIINFFWISLISYEWVSASLVLFHVLFSPPNLWSLSHISPIPLLGLTKIRWFVNLFLCYNILYLCVALPSYFLSVNLGTFSAFTSKSKGWVITGQLK